MRSSASCTGPWPDAGKVLPDDAISLPCTASCIAHYRAHPEIHKQSDPEKWPGAPIWRANLAAWPLLQPAEPAARKPDGYAASRMATPLAGQLHRQPDAAKSTVRFGVTEASVAVCGRTGKDGSCPAL